MTMSYGKFVVEPLERGYGITLGNSLREDFTLILARSSSKLNKN